MSGIAELTELFQAGVTETQREDLAEAVSAGMIDLKLLSMSMQ